VVYDLLLRCGWETLSTFSRNDRQLQGTPGAIAVLHTSTRRLEYHPHAHFVVPAADWVRPRPLILCTCCGGVMKIVRTRIAATIVGEPVAPLAVGGAC